MHGDYILSGAVCNGKSPLSLFRLHPTASDAVCASSRLHEQSDIRVFDGHAQCVQTERVKTTNEL